MPITDNPLLSTDVYKMGHMTQYKPGTKKIVSYLTARDNRKISKVSWFGNQYYLQEYLSRPINKYHVDEFMDTREELLGSKSNEVYEKLMQLQALGYIPLRIKSLKEGSVVSTRNALATYTNTVDGFHWVVGFFESLLLKVWYPSTVTAYSRKLKGLVTKYANETCDNLNHVPYATHDFGYRGVSSEESAAIGGAAHTVVSMGSDTVLALPFMKKYYDARKGSVAVSVHATEHSVVESFGPDHELDYIINMIAKHPTGIISLVADTYNLWRFITKYLPIVRDLILARDGIFVVRPDSGNQKDIICGNQSLATEAERKGAIRCMMDIFGYSVNSKGYMVSNPKVGLIYGDGFYWDRYVDVLETMKQQKLASSNLVVGIGGLLLQNQSRDTQGFTIKAIYSEDEDGTHNELFKDPITDPGKKSLMGLLRVEKVGNEFHTYDHQTKEQEAQGELITTFENSKIVRRFTLDQVREELESYGSDYPEM